MDKIYSRPRLLLPKIKFNKSSNFPNKRFNKNENNSKIRKKIFTIAIVLIIAFIIVFKMLDGIDEIIYRQCETKAKSIATRISNEQATNIMNKYKYDDLFNVQKDSKR